MIDVVNTLIGVALGLITGLVTGLFFERRTRHDAELEAADLRAQLSTLREGLYAANGRNEGAINKKFETDFSSNQIYEWLISHQDGSGEVTLLQLYDFFTKFTNSASDIALSLEELRAAGRVSISPLAVRVISQ